MTVGTEAVSTDPRAAAARVDDLLTRLERLGDSRTRVLAEEIVRALMEFYGAGLAQLTAIAGPEKVRDFTAQPHLGALLAMHGLHPVSTRRRVEEAVERLGGRAHALRLEISGPEGGQTVTVRSSGRPPGPALVAAVEDAVEAAAPEVTVLVEGTGATSPGDLAAGRALLPVVAVSAS
ncbi:hypothetical protein [Parafrankia discariae]|uniref:hypothetical protein n=1 Tax=Parafrankia discariae TaxID=365528 RepID=UPI0012B699B8|nr:hypothetical protein [Parafrankia discariae]